MNIKLDASIITIAEKCLVIINSYGTIINKFYVLIKNDNIDKAQ